MMQHWGKTCQDRGNRIIMVKLACHRAMVYWGIILWGVISLQACDQPPPETDPVVLRPVRYMRAEASHYGELRTFSGIAKASMESKLSFRVSGTIQHLYVKVGDLTHKDQVIAELDPADYKLRVQESQASLARAKAEYRNASANYERVRGLYENRNASRTELDGARAAAESSLALVHTIENKLALANRRLGYTRLQAPGDCAVADIPAEVNENVMAGQSVVNVTCGAAIEVQVGVPGVIIAQIQGGQKVTVAFNALPNMQFKALVTEVGVASTGVETTFPVTVKLENTDQRILPGMAAEVTFQFEDMHSHKRILVPPVAVAEDRKGRYVYIVTKEENGLGSVHRRPVRIGQLTAKGLEILDGIKSGEFVVVAGISRIEDDMQVKLSSKWESLP
jgi:RND family efflux transporter MFP subunit